MSLGNLHSIETFGAVDGPGIRFVIFLKGCNLRCKYCHNPDTWCFNKNNFVSAEDLINKAYRYHSYWKNNGGITVSGGEPLLQIDFLIELFKLAKDKNINTCIDTSLEPFKNEPDFLKKFDELLKYTDLFLVDIKHIDNKKHIELTSKPNVNILEGIKYLDVHNKKMWIRHVLVPKVTDDYDNLNGIYTFINKLHNVDKVEILPYHTFGVYKYKELNLPYRLLGINEPTEEEILRAKKILHLI